MNSGMNLIHMDEKKNISGLIQSNWQLSTY